MSYRAKSAKQNASPCKHSSSDTALFKSWDRERIQKFKKVSGEGTVLVKLGYLCILLVGRDEIISTKNQQDSWKNFYKSHNLNHKNLFEWQAECN